MAIKNIKIKNITVFEKLDMQFSDGINIFIGENGTGKTHLMKILYAVSQERKHFSDAYNNRFKTVADGYSIEEQDLAKRLKSSKLEFKSLAIKDYFILGYFSSNNYDYLSLIRNKQETNNTSKILESGKKEFIENEIIVKLDNEVYEMTFESKAVLSIVCNESINENNKEFVYIPAKEVLSHSKGFISTYDEREIAFDKTWYDIIVKAQKGFLKRLDDDMQDCLNKISEVLGGSVEVKGDQFYIKKNNGLDIEFNYEAEGLRKIGLLWILIRNGSIKKDSVLFWDEPESNLNPNIIPVIVQVLLILQRVGVQIFVATHNYNFAKYFDIKRDSNNEVAFFSLYKNGLQPVSYSTASKYAELKNNPIEKADIKLYDEVVEKALGGD